MTKPTKYPDWALLDVVDPTSGQNNVVEPGATQKNTGWSFKQFPPRQFMNWLFRITNDWLKWFDERLTYIELGFVDRTDDCDFSGWDSFTNKKVFIRVINDIVFVSFIIEGTGNTLNITSISLPFPLVLDATLSMQITLNESVDNGAAPVLGFSVVGLDEAHTDSIIFFPTLTTAITFANSIWPAGGTKKVSGSLWFKAGA